MDSKENSEKKLFKIRELENSFDYFKFGAFVLKKNCIRIRLNMAISKEAVVKS